MGNNSFSKNSYGSIDVQLASEEFYTGECIRGVINLQIDKFFDCKRIAIVFQGKVKKSQTTLNDSSSLSHLAQNTIVDIIDDDQYDQSFQALIADHTVYVKNKNGQNFSVGRYSIPFSLEIDKYLPNSLDIYMSSARYIKIEYFLTCGIESHIKTSHVLFQRKKLIISQKLKFNQFPTVKQQKIIVQNCFTSKKFIIKTNINKCDIKIQSGIIELKIQIETNDLYLPFKRVKIAIYGELSLKGKKYIWETYDILYIKASQFKKVSFNKYEVTKKITNFKNLCTFQSRFISYNNFLKISFQTNYIYILNSTISKNDTILWLNIYKDNHQKPYIQQHDKLKRRSTQLDAIHQKLNNDTITCQKMRNKISLIKQTTQEFRQQRKSKKNKILPYKQNQKKQKKRNLLFRDYS